MEGQRGSGRTESEWRNTEGEEGQRGRGGTERERRDREGEEGQRGRGGTERERRDRVGEEGQRGRGGTEGERRDREGEEGQRGRGGVLVSHTHLARVSTATLQKSAATIIQCGGFSAGCCTIGKGFCYTSWKQTCQNVSKIFSPFLAGTEEPFTATIVVQYASINIVNIHRIILINFTYSKSIVSSTYKCVLCTVQYSTTNVHPSKWPPPMHASTLGSQKTHQTGTQANESHDSISTSLF